MSRYTVTVREDGDTGARWLYGVEGATPDAAVRAALGEAHSHGYGRGRTTVRLYDPSVEGSAYGATVLHEETVES